MRYLFLFICLLAIQLQCCSAQDSLMGRSSKYGHCIKLSIYSSSNGFGGSQIDYQFSYSMNPKTRLVGKIGYFYLSVSSNTGKSGPVTNLRYQYFAFTTGIQRNLSSKGKGYFEFNVGIPLLRYEDSRLITRNFWSEYKYAQTGSEDVRKFMLVQEFNFGLPINRHLSVSAGERMLFATLEPRPEPNRSFACELGLSASIAFTF
jgi:hypothetical protein